MSRNHYYVPMYSYTVRADGTRKEHWVVVDTFDESEQPDRHATQEAARATADALNGAAFVKAQQEGELVIGFAAHK
jgi:quinol monooxygenase YgiN